MPVLPPVPHIVNVRFLFSIDFKHKRDNSEITAPSPHQFGGNNATGSPRPARHHHRSCPRRPHPALALGQPTARDLCRTHRHHASCSRGLHLGAGHHHRPARRLRPTRLPALRGLLHRRLGTARYPDWLQRHLAGAASPSTSSGCRRSLTAQRRRRIISPAAYLYMIKLYGEETASYHHSRDICYYWTDCYRCFICPKSSGQT